MGYTHDDGGKYDFAISLDNPRDAQIGGQQGDLKAEDSETVIISISCTPVSSSTVRTN
jgi:hypothetical protein